MLWAKSKIIKENEEVGKGKKAQYMVNKVDKLSISRNKCKFFGDRIQLTHCDVNVKYVIN
ncbi:hypothetical protein A4S06_09920 [Erysipelotrichaceae bacterium MTC7]|nr:hypothetical protein A4S06_09920 [Erysipelotrichaceae bacterium MTC7]